MNMRAPYSALLIALLVSGCASDLRWHTGRTPWDPLWQEQLMYQLPNWEHEALIRCGGRLTPEERRSGMTDKC